MSCYFQANIQRQKHSESVVAMCCFLMFSSSLQNEGDHQQAIEEKDAAIVLLDDDLKNREYENVTLQAQRDVYQALLQRCQDTITHLKTRYLDHARDPGKDNNIIIVRKHTTPANNKYHGFPYHFTRIQRRKRYVKLRWLDRHFPDHEVIVEIDNPNSIHVFN